LTKISIIIPAFNEEEYIDKTLTAIEQLVPSEDCEIIVVDNGSTDNTVQVAEAYNIKLLRHPNKTISSTRNIGAKTASGEILVFIDSDIIIDDTWYEALLSIIPELEKRPLIVTGSRCHPENNSTWLNHYWFSRLTECKINYINSGHLITTRQLFALINGFTASLKTAEDYDFCMKASAAGAKIIDNPSLKVLHLGYPKKIITFMLREMWHGKEDFQSVEKFLASKIAWIATFNLLSFIASLYLVISLASVTPALVYLVIIFSLSVALTHIKYKNKGISYLINTSIIFSYYIWGRSLSLISSLTSKVINKD